MVMKKKATAAKAAPKVDTAEDSVIDQITILRTYTEDGEINSEQETIEITPFPANAKTGKVAILIGTSSEFGAIKTSVTVSVPALLEEIEDGSAGKFAIAKAQEIFDQLAEIGATEEEPEVEEKPKGKGKATAKAEVTGKRGAKKAPVEEPEEDEEVEEDEVEEDAEEDTTAEDIEAMDRKQLEAFIETHNEECDEGDELEIDLSEFKKNASGLTGLKEAVVAALFGEGYSEEELQEMDEADLKEICKEWEITWPKSKKESVRKAEAIAAILQMQEGADD